MIKRESSCPLCGARMTPTDMIDACVEVSNVELGILAARCPHCQGHFEIRPATDRIDLGYCDGGKVMRFDVALSLACEGLAVTPEEHSRCLVLSVLDRRWVFKE